jgi:hypothetical protein
VLLLPIVRYATVFLLALATISASAQVLPLVAYSPAPFVSSLDGQQECGTEMKILLDPAEVDSAVTSLKAGRKVTEKIYFFDTAALGLLSQGVIVRLRQSANVGDLTVKLRLPADKKIVGTSGEGGRFKCEADVVTGVPLRSYSVQARYSGELPTSGEQVYQLLSSTQKQLLEQAGVSIVWSQVKKVANIKSTDWRIRGQPPFSKLALELWEWPGGKALELSTKVKAADGPSSYKQLQQILYAKGLSLSSTQSSKTAMVLQELTHVHVR